VLFAHLTLRHARPRVNTCQTPGDVSQTFVGSAKQWVTYFVPRPALLTRMSRRPHRTIAVGYKKLGVFNTDITADPGS
jgi:hypothetical protein